MRFLIAGFLCIMLLCVSDIASGEIVFQSKRGGIVGIYVMDDDGSNVRLLTNKIKPANARWSPDGTKIVFERQMSPVDTKNHHIFMMNVDGTNIQQLTAPHEGSDKHASVSPDGKSIVFTRFDITGNAKTDLTAKPWEIGEHSICTMDIETGMITQLADIGANNPVWSPDGQQIAFSNRAIMGESGSNIWIMGADGKNPRELFPNEQPNINRMKPKWSPNGQQVVYLQIENKLVKIKGVRHFVPNAYRYFIYDFGKNQVQQLDIPKNWKSVDIDWMDNGKSVVVSAAKVKLGKPLGRKQYRYNIYKYDLETSKTTRLTRHSGQDLSLSWISDDARGLTDMEASHITLGESNSVSKK